MDISICFPILDNLDKYVHQIFTSGNDFGKGLVHKLLERIENEVNALEQDKALQLTNAFRMDISIFVCMKKIPQFQEMHGDFVQANSLVTYFNQWKDQFEEIFRKHCKGANATAIMADTLQVVLEKALKQSCKQESGDKLIGDIKMNHAPFNGNRCDLDCHILKQLAKDANFDQFMKYINSPRTYYEEYISTEVSKCLDSSKWQNEYRKAYLAKMDSKIIGVLSASERATFEAKKNEGCIKDGSKIWLDEFCSRVAELIELDQMSLSHLYGDEILDFDSVHTTMKNNLEKTKEMLEQQVEKFLINQGSNRYKSLVEHFTSGCWEQCPFCSAVCICSVVPHSEEHRVEFHRPSTLCGWHKINTSFFSTNVCTTKISSDISFRHYKAGDTSGEKISTPYKEYKTAGPPYDTWSIKPDSHDKKYWKWFVSTFDKELEATFKLKFGGTQPIPDEWREITQWEAIAETNVEDCNCGCTSTT